MNKKQLMLAYRRLERAMVNLEAERGKLGAVASEVLGYEVIADICAGNEIEFRRVGKEGVADNMDVIRIENILTIAKW